MKYCPYCGSDKGIEFRYLSKYEDECFSLNLNEPYIYEHTGHMFVSECLNCKRLMLGDDYGGELPPHLFDKAEALYPNNFITNRSIPKEVRVTYENAKRIQHLNSEAFSLSIRKCVEIICKLNGIEKGGLASKLKKLCTKLSLPSLILEAADCIRIVGNQAAHDIEDIHPINARNIDDFFGILIEYIYILPSKLKHFERMNGILEGEDTPPITKDGRWVIQKGKYRGWEP
ncbi:MAG: hypothetical protein ACI88H_002550 [Cocleimonas sp.]|jgi:hypothetical protein